MISVAIFPVIRALPVRVRKVLATVIQPAVVGLLLAHVPRASAQFSEWTGSGSNWSNGSNWTNGAPNGFYGQLEFKGNGLATSNNDLSPANAWRLYFTGTKAYTLTSGGGVANLFDSGGAHSWILSDSTVNQTFSTLNVNFAATVGATFGQISARNTGNLVLNNIGITGAQVSQLRVAGESTGKVIFSGAISGSGKQVVIGLNENAAAATTTEVSFDGTNTYSGDTFVVAGSLSFGSGGTSNSSSCSEHWRSRRNSGRANLEFKLSDRSGNLECQQYSWIRG